MIAPKITNLGYSNLWTDMSTILGYASNFDQQIQKLFANGEQGFFRDPSDMMTMYQDAAGTTAVNASGQPLGLVLDKSKGLLLGGERVVNYDFSNGNTNWTVSNTDATHIVTFGDGKVRYQSGTTTPVLALGQNGVMGAGKWYEVTVVCSDYVSGSLKTEAGNGGVVTVSGLGTFKTKILAISSTLTLARNVANVDLTISSISVKELSGNHAYQATSAARPILQNVPRRIDFDAVDDKLITNLTAQLTGCTVIRSVPNVGTQILTGQTIYATYEDNTDHCGLIVINRALTPSETSAITSEFNKRAGI